MSNVTRLPKSHCEAVNETQMPKIAPGAKRFESKRADSPLNFRQVFGVHFGRSQIRVVAKLASSRNVWAMGP
jgi:hypothetical protein